MPISVDAAGLDRILGNVVELQAVRHNGTELTLPIRVRADSH
jgi:hypothetical protein